jgi:acyl-CoA synthetase (AMP-forming)/AMP-acid ligase II
VEFNLWTIFKAVSERVGSREAIVWRDRRMDFAELSDRARRLATFLNSRGVGIRQDRQDLGNWEIGQDTVGLYLLNGPEYLEASLGSYGARAAPFNVNYRYVAEEMAYLLNDADTAVLIYHARYSATVAEVLPRLDHAPLLLQVKDESGLPLLAGALDYDTVVEGATSTPERDDHSPDDVYLMYTGGTTGMPKGTIWRQADIWLSALGGEGFDDSAELDTIASAATKSTWRILPIAPFMHAASHWLAMRCLLGGGTVVINSIVDRFDPADFWQTVERERVGATMLVGDAFVRPLIAELDAASYDTSSLRRISLGGAVTSPETKQRLLSYLPQTKLIDMAGSTETGSALAQVSVAGSTPEYGIFKRHDDVAVVNLDEGRQLEPGDPEIGWLAKSGSIPLGYLGDRKKTESTFPSFAGRRWSIPGDRARLRADGMVELLGRDSVTINSGGEKIFAEEVEQALLRVSAIEDVIVVGRSSPRWGQEVVAIIQLSPGSAVSDGDLRAAASSHVARYKLPKGILRVPKVERSPTGKADYAWAHRIADATA